MLGFGSFPLFTQDLQSIDQPGMMGVNVSTIDDFLIIFQNLDSYDHHYNPTPHPGYSTAAMLTHLEEGLVSSRMDFECALG